MASYDSIIIGAGHNGLVCATLLARAGHQVLVLEASDAVGGLAAPREFHPGFQAPVAHSADRFARPLAKRLELAKHGLKLASQPQAMVGLVAGGEPIVVAGNKAQGVGKDDAKAYNRYRRQMRHWAQALSPFWLKTMPRIAPAPLTELMTFGHMGLNLRRLGKTELREFLRVFSLPMRDLLDERFESEALKALLSWDGLAGSRMAPRSPNNAVLPLLYRMSGSRVRGGPTALVRALSAAAAEAGVTVRTGCPVARITTRGDASGLAVTGVELESGEAITAERVVSSADPQTTFIRLLGAPSLEIGFSNRIRRLRSNGLVAKLHLALDGAPNVGGVDNLRGRFFTASEMDDIEFAFDDAKYGAPSEAPVMEFTVPSATDSSLAPEGQHVLSAHVMYVPAEINGGWTDEARAALTERLVGQLDALVPGLKGQILASKLLTPADLEREHRVSGGHWHHTEMAVDQMLMMRPTYEAAQYTTPVPGLWLCGAGSHPGGDLTGAPGHNAAREILS